MITKNHGWMYLAVGVGGAVAAFSFLKVIGDHGNHHCFLLQGVNVLDHTSSHQILPAGKQKEKHREHMHTQYRQPQVPAHQLT